MSKFKKFSCMALVVILSIYIIPAESLNANSLSDLQARRQVLSKETDRARKEIANLKDQQLSVEDEIAVMDRLLNSIQSELDSASEDLDAIQSLLDAANMELDAATLQREEQFGLLGSRMRFLQQKGATGYLGILLEAESFGDLFLRMQYVNDIMAFDRQILDALEESQKIIREKMSEIEVAYDAQALAVSYQQEKFDSMQSAINEKEALIRSYTSDEKKYAELIAANNRADQQILAEIAKQTGTVSTVYYTGTGSMQWPVPSKTASSSSLSSGFVQRTNPVTGRWESHSGYDIPAPYGSNIVAAESGVVSFSGWMNGYGYTVMIDHGGGIVTLYAHNSSLVVSKGQTVSRGDVIARCGSTGISTGNHLHFSVLVNGKYVNPQPYLGVANVSY